VYGIFLALEASMLLAHLIGGRYSRTADEPYRTVAARPGWLARLIALFRKRR
jgi:hypothetical protein